MSAISILFVVGHVVIYVASWHVNFLRDLRVCWANRSNVAFCIVLIVSNLTAAALDAATHRTDLSIQCLTQGGCVAYGLYRAWREHRPPRRKLRERASEVGRKLAERMAPARIPVPVGRPMSAAPRPTCRHYVIHIHELGQVITALRIGATRHPGLHSRLMNHVRVTRRIRALLDRHRHDDGCDQRRTAIREFGMHLLDHANEGAAA